MIYCFKDLPLTDCSHTWTQTGVETHMIEPLHLPSSSFRGEKDSCLIIYKGWIWDCCHYHFRVHVVAKSTHRIAGLHATLTTFFVWQCWCNLSMCKPCASLAYKAYISWLPFCLQTSPSRLTSSATCVNKRLIDRHSHKVVGNCTFLGANNQDEGHKWWLHLAGANWISSSLVC